MGSSLILIAVALTGQTNKFDLAQWVDKVVTATEHQEAHRSLLNLIGPPKNTSDYATPHGKFHVWQRGTSYVVLQEHPIVQRPGDSRITVANVDSTGRKMLARTHTVVGYRKSIKLVKRIDRPDISDLVFQVDMSNYGHEDVAQEFFAFDGDRLALVHLGEENKRPARNPYSVPHFTIGPEPPAYDKRALLHTLGNGSLVQRLEALTWMNGYHREPSDKLGPSNDQPMSTVIRFWTLHQDPDVKHAIKQRSSSSDPWERAIAQRFIADWKPLP